ncbi:MAG TPA: 30S ribosomal protein S3 [Clostridiales bacterium]|jgi:ribosomal protein S3|nr:30S ribosomal protein S3 [Subdoligranulum sp.]PWM85725.1 MAG: 30S ribosomal protein S3 [Subdoligranulum sp.]CDE71907.1 30S ribosomal protein S3 [Subdoligranulum sp. CAG:314]HCW82192.1 30S ribosomal protein S3 [Clostridiales bacterium]
MGQKVNPNGLRIGIIKDWNSKWYADKKDIAKFIKEDEVVRTFIKKKYYQSAISSIKIERSEGKIVIFIYTGRPGTLIGKQGAGIEQMKAEVQKLVGDKFVVINIMEVKNPDMDAQLVAENIAAQLEKRIAFRRAMRSAMQRATRAGAKGIKTCVSGRLDGAEIARNEHYHEGSIPLHTLRADIDYGFAEARTTFGIIGVKVWVYKGEILGKPARKEGGNRNVNA